MFVALVRFVFGFVAAVLIAGAVQVLFVAGNDLVRGSAGNLTSLGLLVLLAATQSAVFAAPFAVLAAIFAGWMPIRSVLYYVGIGLVIALAGFLAQYVGEAGSGTILNRYALSAYLVSGFTGGFAYWYIAVPKKRSPEA